MPAPIVVAPFLLARVGMLVAAGALSIALAVLRNADGEKKNMPEEKRREK